MLTPQDLLTALQDFRNTDLAKALSASREARLKKAREGHEHAYRDRMNALELARELGQIDQLKIDPIEWLISELETDVKEDQIKKEEEDARRRNS